MFTLVYRIFSICITPLLYLLLHYRRLNHKEDSSRYREKLGYAAINRPTGFLLWLHAASVGESLSVISLVEHLQLTYPKLQILITTGTVSSTKIIMPYLPSGVMHQYIVIDSYIYVQRFLKHWQPDLAIFIESELWPNLINSTKHYCPLLLINARMSNSSVRNWQLFKFIARKLLNSFNLIITQSKADFDKYKILGANNICNGGNIKYSSNNITINQHKLTLLLAQTQQRKIWLAASTHLADEHHIYRAHLSLKNLYPNLLTIIVPRHPNRSDKIIEHITAHKLQVARRSNADNITNKTDIYLADTFGELNLFYSMATAIFVGGSFVDGGHNIIEPASFGKVIIFGPDMSNTQEIADEFLETRAAIQIHDTTELITSLEKILVIDQTSLNEYASKTTLIINKYKQILTNYLTIIAHYLPKNLND